MSIVGIIANPESGKDIRRLVAAGSVSSNREKVNILTRILIGMGTSGIEQVHMMPDIYGIGREAVDQFRRSGRKYETRVDFLDMYLRCHEIDSLHAAEMLVRLGVRCIITLGGDGTNRIVAKGSGNVPLLPVSTGTNNVFPYFVEGTIAGMAAAVVARELLGRSSTVSRRKKIEILNGGELVDMALIDAVVTTDNDIGAKAIWDIERIRQIVQTFGSLENIGLSSIGGALIPVDHSENCGLSLELGDGDVTVLAPIAPGLIREVPLKSVRRIAIGEDVEVSVTPSIIALDGERHIRVKPGERFRIRLSQNGPECVDIRKTMALASKMGLFRLDGNSSSAG